MAWGQKLFMRQQGHKSHAVHRKWTTALILYRAWCKYPLRSFQTGSDWLIIHLFCLFTKHLSAHLFTWGTQWEPADQIRQRWRDVPCLKRPEGQVEHHLLYIQPKEPVSAGPCGLVLCCFSYQVVMFPLQEALNGAGVEITQYFRWISSSVWGETVTALPFSHHRLSMQCQGPPLLLPKVHHQLLRLQELSAQKQIRCYTSIR